MSLTIDSLVREEVVEWLHLGKCSCYRGNVSTGEFYQVSGQAGIRKHCYQADRGLTMFLYCHYSKLGMQLKVSPKWVGKVKLPAFSASKDFSNGPHWFFSNWEICSDYLLKSIGNFSIYKLSEFRKQDEFHFVYIIEITFNFWGGLWCGEYNFVF